MTRLYQQPQSQHSMVENIRLMVVMQQVSEFGKKTTLHLLWAMRTGGIQTQVQTIHQLLGADWYSPSEELTVTVVMGHLLMVVCRSSTYNGCARCN